MLLSELVVAFRNRYEGRDPSLFGRLDFWIETVGHLAVDDLTADVIDQQLLALAERGKAGSGKPLSAGTLNRYRSALASVFKWAKGPRVRLLPRTWRSPLADIPAEKEPQGRLTYYTKDEVERLVAAARCGAWPKLPALVMMAFVTGLRRGSLLALRWSDVDLEAGRASVERTKNGSAHVAILTPAAVAELRAIRPRHIESGQLIFCGKHPNVAHDFRHSYERAIEVAGVPRLVFHALRHSCASHLARNNVSLVQIAGVLAHKNFATTKRYAHLAVGDRETVISQHFA